MGHRGAEGSEQSTAGDASASDVRYDDITRTVIGCAIEVHRNLGPGLLESVYEDALAIELRGEGIAFDRQKSVPVIYKGSRIGDFRIDFVVADCVVVEIKSVERDDPVFAAQVLSYLRLGGYHLGLLINFNTRLHKDGIKRYVVSEDPMLDSPRSLRLRGRP
jgi:GxxExxY protein